MLKKIRKKNEVTNRNLEEALKSLDANLKLDLNLTPFNLFTFIDDFKLSEAFNSSVCTEILKFNDCLLLHIYLLLRWKECVEKRRIREALVRADLAQQR